MAVNVLIYLFEMQTKSVGAQGGWIPSLDALRSKA